MTRDASGRGLPPVAGAASLCAAALWACPALASFGGSLGPTDPKVMYALAAALALPTALACVMAEAILPRRRVPVFVACGAALVAIVLLLAAFGVIRRAEPGWLWFVIPPIATLALRGLVPRPLPRLAVGVAISVLSVKLGSSVGPQWRDALPVLAGGATTCLLLWVGTVLLIWKKGWTPPETTDAKGVSNTIASVLPRAVLPEGSSSWSDLGPRVSEWFEASLSRRRGVGWWLATALVLYLGLGLVIALGGLRDGFFIQAQVFAVAELFGLPQASASPTNAWWLFGLPWSLLVAGAAWGIAGLVGGFDPGRMRAVRLAAIVFGVALLLWTVHVAWNIETVWAAEEAASSGR